MNNKEDELLPCIGCGEPKQLEVITVDRTDKSRDKIKCRHCKTSAYRSNWNRRHLKEQQVDQWLADRGEVRVPVRNVKQVEDSSDFSLDIVFASCRARGEFKAMIKAAKEIV